MALVWLDSFDHYGHADLPAKYAASSLYLAGSGIGATAGRRGSGAAQSWNAGELDTRALAPASTTAIVGVAMKFSALPGAAVGVLLVLSAGAIQLTLAINASGVLSVYRGSWSGGTLLGTATMTGLAVNAYAFLELKTLLHTSAGTVVVRVDEVEVLNLTGVNTANTGTAAWDAIRLRAAQDSFYFDDFYVLDGSGAAPLNGFLGDCRVDARFPTAAGATTAWTPSTGANWACVDDATPNADTDYVATSTVGATDTYTIQDAPVPGATLYGVQLCASLKKSGTGTCSVAPVVRHSGADYAGAATTPGTAYAYQVTPYGTNPGTSAAWTESGFNAAEFGITRTA